MIMGIASFSIINGIVAYKISINLKKKAEIKKRALEERRVIRLKIMKTLRAKYYKNFNDLS
ncbi:hypothetical protein Fokcrypt_00585 [Candidatus Fokinia cryptica]|uniref:Uncharacterized protein n=2 Tax=Candidatus Fokinia crypta TaxID=1920990 RepID=A0ABZ0UR57_9RICK|nr:hypothetical protein Fokcrypt_00585 [Candidatus Fokinia cryptica]